MKVLLENNTFLGSAARVGLMVEFLSQDRGVSDSSLIGVTVLSPWARHINPCLVVLLRKTSPDITKQVDEDVKNQSKLKFVNN